MVHRSHLNTRTYSKCVILKGIVREPMEGGKKSNILALLHPLQSGECINGDTTEPVGGAAEERGEVQG